MLTTLYVCIIIIFTKWNVKGLLLYYLTSLLSQSKENEWGHRRKKQSKFAMCVFLSKSLLRRRLVAIQTRANELLKVEHILKSRKTFLDTKKDFRGKQKAYFSQQFWSKQLHKTLFKKHLRENIVICYVRT
jgi:hypothetical protein